MGRNTNNNGVLAKWLGIKFPRRTEKNLTDNYCGFGLKWSLAWTVDGCKSPNLQKFIVSKEKLGSSVMWCKHVLAD